MEAIQMPSVSYLQTISLNVVTVIFEFLTQKEICCVGATCKRLQKASEMEMVWVDSLDKGNGVSKKRTFLQRGNITRNIMQGKPQRLMLKGHNDMISRINVSGSKVLTSSRDCDVCVWDLDKSKGKRFKGHTNWVVNAYDWNDRVVSVSADKTIRVWEDPEQFKVMRGHSSGITCSKLAEEGDILVTGSHDMHVKIWSLNRSKCVSSVKYFNNPVSGVYIEDNILVCNSQEEPNMYIRDMQREETLIHMHTPRQPNGRHLTLVSNEIRTVHLKWPVLYTGGANSVKVWDLRMPEMVAEEELPYTLRKTMSINGDSPRGVFDIKLSERFNCLVVGCMGLMGLVTFDLRKMRELHHLKSHDYPILSMDVGKDVLNNIAATSGTSVNYQYEISMHDLSNPDTKKSKVVPGHKAVITALRVSDNSVFSGGKDGSVNGICFKMRKELLRNTNTQKTVLIK